MTLEARGVLPAAEAVWRVTSGELDAAAAGTPPVTHTGPDRWEPFLALYDTHHDNNYFSPQGYAAGQHSRDRCEEVAPVEAG